MAVAGTFRGVSLRTESREADDTTDVQSADGRLRVRHQRQPDPQRHGRPCHVRIRGPPLPRQHRDHGSQHRSSRTTSRQNPDVAVINYNIDVTNPANFVVAGDGLLQKNLVDRTNDTAKVDLDWFFRHRAQFPLRRDLQRPRGGQPDLPADRDASGRAPLFHQQGLPIRRRRWLRQRNRAELPGAGLRPCQGRLQLRIELPAFPRPGPGDVGRHRGDGGRLRGIQLGDPAEGARLPPQPGRSLRGHQDHRPGLAVEHAQQHRDERLRRPAAVAERRFRRHAGARAARRCEPHDDPPLPREPGAGQGLWQHEPDGDRRKLPAGAAAVGQRRPRRGVVLHREGRAGSVSSSTRTSTASSPSRRPRSPSVRRTVPPWPPCSRPSRSCSIRA